MKKYGLIFAIIMVLTAFCVMPAMAADITDFAGLQTAFQNGGTYKLTADITVTSVTRTSQDLTIDLNGHAIINSVDDALRVQEGGKLTINDTAGNGLIKGGSPLRVTGGSISPDVKVESTITINGGTITTTDTYCGVFVIKNGATLNVNGGTINGTHEDSCAIMGNGNASEAGTIINIKGGNIAGKSIAIYHPQNGVLNISGGTISGSDGIQFKSGTLSMTGGTITTTGSLPANFENNNNGSVETGAAISFITSTAYTGKMNLKISGAAKLTAKNSYALIEAITQGTITGVVNIDIAGGTFTGKDKAVHFQNWASLTMKSLTGGKYSSDPSSYVTTAGYNVVKVGDMYAVQKQTVNPTPTLPTEVPASVDVVAATTTVVATDATEEEKTVAKEVAIVSADAGTVTSADLDIDAAGNVVAKETVVKAAAEKAIKTEELNETVKAVVALPIFSAALGDGKETAAVGITVKGSELFAANAGGVKVLKILSAENGQFFDFESNPANTGDGEFAIQAEGSTAYMASDAVIEADKTYKLLLFIADNGTFDLNKTKGEILDPAAIVQTAATPTPTPSGSSSGGCSAGYGVLALLALLPMAYYRKK